MDVVGVSQRGWTVCLDDGGGQVGEKSGSW